MTITVSVMDPPWGSDAGGGGKGANAHYALEGVDGIALAIRKSGLWRDTGPALCWMWATASALHLGDVHALCGLLHIRPVAGLVWAKIDAVDANTFHPCNRMGLGQWTRCEHEHLLICRRGVLGVPPPAHRHRSMIYAPRLEHSQKPEKAWAIIEDVSAAIAGDDFKGIEFFSRNVRPGWTGWGHLTDGVTDAVTISRATEERLPFKSAELGNLLAQRKTTC